MDLVRRNGRPAEQRHCIQREINRKLHMDESTLALRPAGDGWLPADLQALVRQLLATDPR